MRPIAPLLSLAFLAAGIVSAEANLTLPVDREIGTLTCQTRSAARAIGSTSVADCTFVSDQDGTTQSYVAVFGKRAKGDSLSAATKISWRVMTRNGVERPGMLSGSFNDPAEWQVAPQKGSSSVTLVGATASLKPEAPTGQAAVKLVKSLAGLELIGKTVVASR